MGRSGRVTVGGMVYHAKETAKRLDLEATMRPPGRPLKETIIQPPVAAFDMISLAGKFSS